MFPETNGVSFQGFECSMKVISVKQGNTFKDARSTHHELWHSTRDSDRSHKSL